MQPIHLVRRKPGDRFHLQQAPRAREGLPALAIDEHRWAEGLSQAGFTAGVCRSRKWIVPVVQPPMVA